MNIKTKYDIGQTVWINIQNHGINSYEIKKIQVHDRYGSLLVEYSFSDYGNPLSYEDCQLHATEDACKAATSA